MSESNSETIRKAYQDLANGNIPAVFAAFDPAISWRSWSWSAVAQL